MKIKNGVAATDLGAVTWVKSRRSGAQGNCVELARLADGAVAVRNSRDPEGPALVFTPAEMTALFQGVRDGEFDHFIG
ncbi:hypothetical protein Ais01nite_48000 [Asanoa ishikariensis]|uniref:DUF397 domain-containing protein n=1 Tax=Asanoa ishikariensis TaxID=137265 RepID=A0A1H3RVQ4_9ACTN|nr:DUF397 domain-containing protein [Asanoa ishikariensis]GIF66765.1 hypothetical protein Ais01nite_48000 [Asanoa ishikariensis]SDZ29824.1 protein of unknown function [Asanoa ishikariensis]